MKIQALALAFMAATAIGGVAWVFLYPILSGEKKAESRRASIAKSAPTARQADKSQRSRREQVEGTLRDLEARRAKEKKVFRRRRCPMRRKRVLSPSRRRPALL